MAIIFKSNGLLTRADDAQLLNREGDVKMTSVLNRSELCQVPGLLDEERQDVVCQLLMRGRLVDEQSHDEGLPALQRFAGRLLGRTPNLSLPPLRLGGGGIDVPLRVGADVPDVAVDDVGVKVAKLLRTAKWKTLCSTNQCRKEADEACKLLGSW